MHHWLEPLAGGVVLAVTLLDVFLTLLYARALPSREMRRRDVTSARPED